MTVGQSPAASADTFVNSFASISSTPVGCTGIKITAISENVGVRYYHDGHRLHFPTGLLRFDAAGHVELTATAKTGYAISQRSAQVWAPTTCFTGLHPDPGSVGYEPIISWCTGVAHPHLEQWFNEDAGVTIAWRLVRKKNHHVVAHGSQTSDEIQLGPVPAAVPRGLPRGRYVLKYRNAASPSSLFPYAYQTEHYRCVTASTKPGAVTFKVPAGGPDVSLDLYLEDNDGAPSKIVTVKAGHSYRLHTAVTQMAWRALPLGDHVGNMGFEFLTVPQA